MTTIRDNNTVQINIVMEVFNIFFNNYKNIVIYDYGFVFIVCLFMLQTVKNHMRTECKCHGLSGSCTLKTCWRKMPIFRHVGIILKQKFDGAIQVQSSNDGKRLETVLDTLKPPAKADIVYSEKSPLFCKRNRKIGSLGTKGRECIPDSMGVGGCDLLCCQRGYSTHKMTIRDNCKCRFIWCCDVRCETCMREKTIYRCL